MRLNLLIALAGAALFSFGCQTAKVTNTARSAQEQLLCTRAVDLALGKVVFPQVSNRKVYIDNKLLNSVDKEYVQGALCRKIAMSGAMMIKNQKDADIIIEVFSGCVGTDYNSWLIGLPESGLPIPLAGTVNIPEIALYKRERQSGTGKIGLIMLDNKTHKSMLSVPLLYGESYYNRFMILFVPFTTSNTYN
ncbi:MAG: hypothetical protein GY750_15270 [Lentisphaerae bacterium]|nr:hypothetical protein [Lentisphaerota bacterium]MCP4102758.1 hypothetical protein [Lentisphaerota bacterium]